MMNVTETSSDMSVIMNTTDALPMPLPDSGGFFAIPFHAYRGILFYGNIIVRPIMSVLGILGNVITIMVLYKDPNNKKQSIFTYLMCLMAFDILFLLVGILLSVNDTMQYFDSNLGIPLRVYAVSFRPYIFTILKHMTAIILILMSLERWMSLVFPFKVKQTILVKYPLTIIGVSFVATSAYLTPFILRYSTFYQDVNSTRKINETVTQDNSNKAMSIFVFVETIILHYILPSIVLVLNINVIIAYRHFVNKRKATVKKRANNEGGDDKGRITLVVLGVTGLYIFLALPTTFIQTLSLIYPEYNVGGEYEFTFKFFVELGNFLAKVYASTDFFIYILVSKRNREIFVQMLNRQMSKLKRTFSGRSISHTNPEFAETA